MKKTAHRVGADIGGTFTDIALETSGELIRDKTLTDTARPERGIIEGIGKVIKRANIGGADIKAVIHGTTLVANALIQRRGAKTAFVTTRGFRDVVEIRTESRFEQYDLNLRLPTPLVAREHRYVIDERMGAQGEVLKKIRPEALRRLAHTIAAADYESVAVGLLHAYADNAHERQVARALRRAKPGLNVCLSSEVSAQMREFERFNSVCANAFVRPMVSAYLRRLSRELQKIGVGCPVFMMHSGGGLISAATARRFPVRLLESGPAGGAIYAARLAQNYGVKKAVSFDMGGTTAKICLIRDGNAKTVDTFEVARAYRFKKGSGMPVSTPAVEMVEIGAGGGSVASVDGMGQLRVGPQSAGATPGPACYQFGGELPTVTDANLVLGILRADCFAGGAIPLSVDAAQTALRAHVADKLRLSPLAAAAAVGEVVNENMANAARVHAVENGETVAQYTMIAFGGGAPLHACRVCDKLGIDDILIPAGAGVGSAIGFLIAPFSHQETRGDYQRLSAFRPAAARAALDGLRRRALSFVAAAQKKPPQCRLRAVAFMRYAGQGWEIPAPLPPSIFAAPDAAGLRRCFEKCYRALFGRTLPAVDIEIVNWSVAATTPAPAAKKIAPRRAKTKTVAGEAIQLFDPRRRRFAAAIKIDRGDLRPGDAVSGPAIIMETETSIIVAADFSAVMQDGGAIRMRRKKKTPGP